MRPDERLNYPPPCGDFTAVARLVADSRRKLVVLDDDPTGTQTVHGIDVLTSWAESALARALRDPRPAFFILTNSRSLPERESVELAQTLAANLRAAAQATGQDYTMVSRSDSTLRGHFPAEIDALGGGTDYDAVFVVPAFFEGGRVTVEDIHYLREGERWTPVGETEFARDETFGYRSSNLREWIAEKTRGRIAAESVVSISLGLLRGPRGAKLVRDRLLSVARGAFVVVNAAEYADLEVFVRGLLLAEATGRNFLGRTAASFVRVRAGLDAKPLLGRDELRGAEGQGGLLVVGSYTQKTSAQLENARAHPQSTGFELSVGRLAERGGAEAEIARLAPAIDGVLREERTAIVYTSRERTTALGRAGDLMTGKTVSDALVRLVSAVRVRPRFLIAKGGITSSDIAVRALGVQRALILGQAEPGIPVWQTGAESRWPGLAYVVFPGNVGEAATLRHLLDRLTG